MTGEWSVSPIDFKERGEVKLTQMGLLEVAREVEHSQIALVLIVVFIQIPAQRIEAMEGMEDRESIARFVSSYCDHDSLAK